MEPKGSLPYSQEPYTGPYPWPDNPVYMTPSYLSKICLNTIHQPANYNDICENIQNYFQAIIF
jgi:hypothetical protein